MKRTIYVFSDGTFHRKGNTLYFETSDGDKKYLPVENIQEILIMGEVDLNKRFLEFLTQQEIILHFFNHYGYYVGSYYPREHYNSGYMILKQAEFYLDKGKRMDIAKRIVEGAIQNMEKVLSYYLNRGKNVKTHLEKIASIKEKVDEMDSISELMALEGNVREQYYHAFDKILEAEEFIFESLSLIHI